MLRPARILWLLVTSMALVSAAAMAALTPAPFTLDQVAPGVWAAIDNAAARETRAGANAGFIIGSDGVLVVDTFEFEPAAKELLSDIRQKTSLPIRFVVNTHYHLDHVAGNSIFAAAGATVLAQENVRAWERTENQKFFGPKITAAQKQAVESLALPTLTYQDGVEIYLGSRAVWVRSFPGHTGSDSMVFVPDANVVFSGDLFWNHTLPNLIDASTKPWLETLASMMEQHPRATFVPGHGAVGHVEDVGDFRGYLSDLRNDVAQAQAAGQSGDALIAAVLPELQQKYASWGFFSFAKPDIHYTDLELRGEKRLPEPPAQ